MVGILSDDDTEVEITKDVVEEIINDDIIEVFEKILDTDTVKTNDMDLETRIRGNSWFMCDKCEYKTKSENSLGKHEEKKHAVICDLNKKDCCFCCEKFEYKTEFKYSLEIHMIKGHAKRPAECYAWVVIGGKTTNLVSGMECNICENHMQDVLLGKKIFI